MSFGDTTLTVIGNLTSDPDVRFTPSGDAVASFTIAASRRVFDKNANQWKDGKTLFMRCTAWREVAEHAGDSLAKGMRVIAHGRLEQQTYTDREDIERTVVTLDVEEVGPSLKYATAQVTKATRAGGGAPHPAEATGSGWGGTTTSNSQGNPWQSAPAGAAAGGGFTDEPPF